MESAKTADKPHRLLPNWPWWVWLLIILPIPLGPWWFALILLGAVCFAVYFVRLVVWLLS